MKFKRILPVLLIICLLVGLLPAAALAAETILVAEWWIGDGGHMLEYGASDKTRETFESAWNKAMEAADSDHSKMMHFKLYADWNGDSDGDLATYAVSSGPGFNWWAIYIQDGAQVTIDLNGHMINRRLSSVPWWRREGNGEVIYVDEGATLIIEDSDPGVQHGGYVNNEGLWRLGGDTLTNIYGGVITGGYSGMGAGGIHMVSNSHVVLKGGTIAGNASTEGTVDICGGGGGVQVDGDGALFEMYSGTAIKYNAAIDNDGGGVEVWNGAFVMHGGEISYNRAADDGGGVHTFEDDGTAFTMYHGEISYNSAENGGGLYVDSSVLIEDGYFPYNSASEHGGGIYFNDDDSPIVNSVQFEHNEAPQGGAVYINTDDVEIHDSIFYFNTADIGGAVYCDNDNAIFTNCKIGYNTATEKGSGLFFYGKDAVISDCFIRGNTAPTDSGIYIDNSKWTSCAYKVSNTEIRNNNGVVGLYVGTKNTITLSGKNLIGSQDGAGMYVAKDAKISAEGASFDSAVWLDSDADIGSIISTDRGSHNVQGFRYADGRRGLLWVNDPYSGDYRQIKVVSAEEIEEQIATETVPTRYLELLDYSVGDRQYDLLKGIYSYSSCNDATLDNNAIFYYSDGYFDRAPDEYDTHLATMSMNLAMSGFYSSRGQSGTCYYQDGNAYAYPSETDYSNRHASVRQLLSDIGVTDENIYVNDWYVTRPTPDTIGVAVGQKPLCYEDGTKTGYTLIPVVIRSANYEQEWVSNVTLGDGSENGGEAKGFSSAADKAMQVVETYIADYGLTDAVAAGKVKFWVVGYSRGGATANILSKRLTDKYSDPANGGSQVFGYCFEAPKGGVDKAVVNAGYTYNGEYHNIHNCINICDLVPMVGPMQMGFHRYGVDHYVPGDPLAGTVTATEKRATKDSSYTRQNGETSTCVTTYADNSPYYVKPVDTYVKNHDDADLEKYYPQRAKAVEQLRSVCPDILLDDYFFTAELSYTRIITSKPLVKKAGDEDEIPRMDQWIEDFVKDLLSATDMSRTNFATKPVVIENVLGDKIGGLTFQQAIQNAIGLVFALPADKMAALTDRFSHYSKYLSGWSYADLITLYLTAIGHWDTITETERYAHIKALWAELRLFGIDEIFSEEEYDALEEAWPTLADVLLRFVSKDYEDELVQGVDETQAHLGTLLYNIGRVGANHYPEINLAWLRSYDSFYTTDIPGTETGVSTHIVREQPKTAEAPRAYIGETELVSGAEAITLEGTQTLLLSTEADGDAIYYTVSIDGEEDGTLHIYRNGIELAEDLEDTSYTVTTYAMQYGAKSASKTYRVKIEASGPVLPPLRIRSASLHIAEDINMIYAAEVPEGYTDPYMVFTLNGVDHRVDTYTVNSKGQYCFELTAITPQCMGDNISATLYAKAGRKTRSVTKAEYSVRTYCASMLAKTDDALFVTLLSDLLTYGAAAQNYTAYKTESLVTDGLDLTPTPTPRLAGLTEEFEGTADPNTYWTSASLTLRNNVDMNLYFETDNIEGLSVVLEINGRTETITEFDPAYGEQTGYQIVFHGILATEFGLPVSASFYRNGVKIGNTLKYTVNAYACSKQYDSDETLAAMVLALFNYGSTANYYYFARYLQQ